MSQTKTLLSYDAVDVIYKMKTKSSTWIIFNISSEESICVSAFIFNISRGDVGYNFITFWNKIGGQGFEWFSFREYRGWSVFFASTMKNFEFREVLFWSYQHSQAFHQKINGAIYTTKGNYPSYSFDKWAGQYGTQKSV